MFMVPLWMLSSTSAMTGSKAIESVSYNSLPQSCKGMISCMNLEIGKLTTVKFIHTTNFNIMVSTLTIVHVSRNGPEKNGK